MTASFIQKRILMLKILAAICCCECIMTVAPSQSGIQSLALKCKTTPVFRSYFKITCRVTVYIWAIVVSHRNLKFQSGLSAWNSQTPEVRVSHWLSCTSGNRNGGVIDIRTSEQTRINRKKNRVPTVARMLNSMRFPWCDPLVTTGYAACNIVHLYLRWYESHGKCLIASSACY